MVFSGAFTIVRLSSILLVAVAIIASATWAHGSGTRGSRRSDPQVMRQAPSGASLNRRSDPTDGHPQHLDRGFQRRRPARVIVVPAPTYYYSPYYFVARPAVVNAPFFCLGHAVGFISRVGLIDHLGGTHKLPLQDAAAICPQDVDTCVFEGVWPLY